MRDRLIELFDEMNRNPEITCPVPNEPLACKTCKYSDGSAWFCDTTARRVDYLLANGVIVPMCYIWQPIWYICEHIYAGTVEIEEGKISMIQQKADKSWKFRITVNSSVWDFTPEKIGTRYFLTKEEAERELRKRGENNA